jgi:DNA polymerase III epsilon subunit-like protein
MRAPAGPAIGHHGPVTRQRRPEIPISIDVEASGPSPGTGSLLSIGACLVHDLATSFYRELQPIPGLPWERSAERIHGLSRVRLAELGATPADAMTDFVAWVASVAPEDSMPVFVAFNAPFDWMFVADYLHRFVGHNPFGYAALDLKAVYLGRHGVARWAETTKEHVRARYPVDLRHTHNALDDARFQAVMARGLLEPRPDGGPSTEGA